MSLFEFIKWYRAAGAPCLMHALTGWYCPGCGGTRAVWFLLTGHPVMSLIYHPLVPYTAAVVAYILIRHGIDLIQKKGLRQKYLRLWMLWVALGIVIVNFIVKNFALLVLHIDLLK